MYLSQVQAVTKTDKTFVYSELHLLANASDNDAIYRCEASNSAIDIPVFSIVKMNVYCKYLTHNFLG